MEFNEVLKKLNKEPKELSFDTGVSIMTLYRLMAGTDPSVSVCKKLYKAGITTTVKDKVIYNIE